MEINISLNGNLKEITEITKLLTDMNAEAKKLYNGDLATLIDEEERLLLTYFNELDDLEKGRLFSKTEALAEAARRQRKAPNKR